MTNLDITVLTGIANDYDSMKEVEFSGTPQEIVAQMKKEDLLTGTYPDYDYSDKDQFIEDIYTDSSDSVMAVAFTDDFKKDSSVLYW